MNIDEESNYEVATNHFKGRSYTYFDPEKNDYLPTAFHASFTVFVYENLLLKNHIHKRYWVVFCNIVSGLLLSLSILYFYQLSLKFLSQKLAYYGTFFYCIFPSILYYIGSLFWYEQIVLSMLVIVIFLSIKSIQQKLSVSEIIMLAGFMVLGSLFRVQTIAIFVPLAIMMMLFLFFRRNFKSSLTYLGILFIGIAAHYPSLNKNKQLFGQYMISTQFGYEILQGHNPYAKGSWMGDWLLPQSKLYQFSHQNIPHLNQLNQYDEGLARKKLAIDWIKENPMAEIKLIFRKLLLFFFPRNFEFLPLNQFPNPLNLIIYIGFLAYVAITIINKIKNWDFEKVILFIPIVGSLSLTLIFFMGARWRYYAEPFMIIFAFMAIQYLVTHNTFLKNKFDGFQK
jgi:hypothetical protein